MPWALTVMCVTKWYISYSVYLYSSCWLYMYKVCKSFQNIYKAEINWSSLLIYGDLNFNYNVIYQPLLFALINSRYNAFKAEVLKDSHCETADFLARYMYIIQMVLTLISGTRKTTLHCISALFLCRVPNIHCTQSQLRTICTCVTDYTHEFVRYTLQMQRSCCPF